jgi:beta-phosphoglucomutase family hydrolase
MNRAVLWDLDGTLVDSADYHWRAWRDTLARAGSAITYEQFLDGFGQKNDRILRMWFGADLAPRRIEELGGDKEAAYRRITEAEGLSPLPGAAAWLESLRQSGWKQAIASSAPRANVDLMLRVAGLERYFDARVAAEDVSIGKPDPEVFLAAASQLGLTPSRCIVVEDALAGIEAARRAGMKCIGVTTVMPLPADIFVATLANLSPGAFESLVA